ncbi:MbtH family protein [Priestia flexa]|jgi:uncharacterized protein YbdZ (MbtH family)|uniref:Protein mbtH n=2 Tax=Priestia TaxID=2800373 RepID=A0A0V8JNI4_9BACI|nr:MULTISPECIES: MbtH family protein [Bacillaceae]KSU88603.1 protein mbtH [Priestia veravalensis]KZB91932.1 protein mbtH [Bacillus sp. VT 712]MBN8251052.1 MbtH family protein [Priestia flexa]MBN8433269.1 MbtH family protein [Priestia flexa]MCA0965795.1 MbtH family protein [Priestia flexa]
MNPFENQSGSYLVLINEEGQHSLWPTFVEVPLGWKVVYGESNRESCLKYINSHWIDIKPNSLKLVASSLKGN